MRRRLVNCLLVAGSITFALALAEAGLRLCGVSYPNLYQHDYYRGSSLRPGAEGRYTKEGNAYVRINSDGLRDVEHSEKKPKGTYRIAFLGDSYAEAFQVPLEQSFWKVMERDVGACPGLGGRKIEAINFGVSGYGTAQELVTLQRSVWKYSPDLVLLSFTTWNDVRNNSLVLEPDRVRPFYTLQEGALVLDDSFRESARFRRAETWPWRLKEALRAHFHLAQLVFNVTADWNTRRGRNAYQDPRFEGIFKVDNGLDLLAFRPPADRSWQDAWTVTDALLTEFNREVRAKDAKFLVVTLTAGFQVNPDLSVRETVMQRLGTRDLFYPDERIKQLGEMQQFAVLNLAQPFAAYATEHHAYLHGFLNAAIGEGHWNVEGHRLAGDLIAQKVCQMELAPAGS